MKTEKNSPHLIRNITAALAVLMASCGSVKDPRYFHTYTQSDPGILDPFYSTDVISGRILTMICNGLFAVDHEGKLACDLAESYSFDGTRLSVTLRSGVRFHDGEELTADDVLFSFRRVRDSSNPTSPRRWMFASVADMEKKGRYRITLKLKTPHAVFPYLLTMPGSFILSRNSDFSRRRIIGTGPFRLAEWKQDESILLLRHDAYFRGKPGVEGIEYRIIPEDLTARFEFASGKLDYFEMPFLSSIDPEPGKGRTVDIPELSVHYIALNCSRAPFNDRRFRRALNRAVDGRTIMRSLFPGRFVLSTGPVPPGTGGYAPVSDSVTPFDPAGSRKDIEKLGLHGYRITLLVKADNQAVLTARLVQHFLSSAGLDVAVLPLEWSAMKSRTLRGDFDMAYFTWHADYPEPENFLGPLFHSANIGPGGNRSFFSDHRVDALLDMARRTIDREKRFDIYRRAEGIIRSEAPWIFLWFGGKRVSLSERVHGFEPYRVFTAFKGDGIRLIGR